MLCFIDPYHLDPVAFIMFNFKNKKCLMIIYIKFLHEHSVFYIIAIHMLLAISTPLALVLDLCMHNY